MKKIANIILVIVTASAIFACSESKTKISDSDKTELTKLEIPDNYDLLAKAEGDLDGDGVNETVFVYNTDQENEYGNIRDIYICKKEKDEWMLWKKLNGPVMESKSGGTMGDSFDGITIDKEEIFITHMGGASEKWYYNHSYKLIDKEFKLTKAVIDFGRACQAWETYIYNLNTGDLSYDLAPDECDDVKIEEYVIADHKDYKIKKSKLPKMDGFVPGNTELQIPDDAGTLYY